MYHDELLLLRSSAPMFKSAPAPKSEKMMVVYSRRDPLHKAQIDFRVKGTCLCSNTNDEITCKK